MIQSIYLAGFRWRRALRLAALILAAAAASLAGAQAGAQDRYRTDERIAPPLMPALVGRTLDEAREMLAEARIGNAPAVRSAEHPEPPGRIYGQSPPARTPVDARTPIVLNVSAGPRAPLMPALVGRTLGEARQMLAEARIGNAPAVRSAEHPEPRGVIYGQSPPASARVNARTPIVLDVSAGPPLPLMPALVGRTLDEARQALAERHIGNAPAVRSAEHPEQQGIVYGQAPEPQTRVGAATAITLDVSSGPPPPAILMPALVGRTLDEARQALAERQIQNRLAVRRAEHPEPREVIYGQSPQAGAPVDADDAIILDVSDGPPPAEGSSLVAIPPLEGLGEAEAIASLERSGLIAVLDGSEESPLVSGQVIRSSPPGGERVRRGSAVRYILSLGPPPESLIDRLLRNPLPGLLALLVVAAILAAAIVARFMMPRPGLAVRLAGPPRGKVDWGEPPDLAFEVSVDPPKARMRRLAADPDEEGV